jgi:hypothetical protein
VAYFLCALVNGPDINPIRSLADKTCSVSSDWLARPERPKMQNTNKLRRQTPARGGETKQSKVKETSENQEDLGH